MTTIDGGTIEIGTNLALLFVTTVLVVAVVVGYIINQRRRP